MNEEVCDAHKPAIQPRPKGVQARVCLEFVPCPVVHLLRLNPLVEIDVGSEQSFPDIPVGWYEFIDVDHVVFSRLNIKPILATFTLWHKSQLNHHSAHWRLSVC
jgi:hypothetical protein